MPHEGHGHDDDFHPMEAKMDEICDGHGEMDADQKNYEASKKKLFLVSFVTVFFIIAQSIGGYLSGSIAIFTDTAHLASDMVGFSMSMIALKLSIRPTSETLTSGWARAEVVGPTISVVFLLDPFYQALAWEYEYQCQYQY